MCSSRSRLHAKEQKKRAWWAAPAWPDKYNDYNATNLQLRGIQMNLELKGKVAIVTGGSTGTGAAVSKMLAEEGCHVVC